MTSRAWPSSAASTRIFRLAAETSASRVTSIFVSTRRVDWFEPISPSRVLISPLRSDRRLCTLSIRASSSASSEGTSGSAGDTADAFGGNVAGSVPNGTVVVEHGSVVEVVEVVEGVEGVEVVVVVLAVGANTVVNVVDVVDVVEVVEVVEVVGAPGSGGHVTVVVVVVV